MFSDARMMRYWAHGATIMKPAIDPAESFDRQLTVEDHAFLGGMHIATNGAPVDRAAHLARGSDQNY